MRRPKSMRRTWSSSSRSRAAFSAGIISRPIASIKCVSVSFAEPMAMVTKCANSAFAGSSGTLRDIGGNGAHGAKQLRLEAGRGSSAKAARCTMHCQRERIGAVQDEQLLVIGHGTAWAGHAIASSPIHFTAHRFHPLAVRRFYPLPSESTL